jgi:ubiquitin-protein ligase
MNQTNTGLLSEIIRAELASVNNNLSFTQTRLLKDLNELETQIDPDLGISARPLDKNLHEWHANIKAPQDSQYDGGIFHFSI